MRIIFISLLLSMSVQAGPLHWKLIEKSESFQLWQRRDNKAILGTIQVSTKKGAIPQGQDIKKFVEKTKKRKANILKLMGAKNWKIQKSSWEHNKLTLSGTYESPTQGKIKFWEVHHYQKNKVTQLMYSQPQKITKNYFKDFIELAGKGTFIHVKK